MRVIAAGPLAAAGSAMPVKIAKGTIEAYLAPFRRPGPPGVHGPLLHLEANVDGVKSDAPQLVNSIHTLHSLHFSSSHSSSLFVPLSLSQSRPGPWPSLSPGEWSTTDANSALELPPIYLECCRDHGHLFGSEFSHWGRHHSRSTGSPESSY